MDVGSLRRLDDVDPFLDFDFDSVDAYFRHRIDCSVIAADDVGAGCERSLSRISP
jgi:hypothetical protein